MSKTLMCGWKHVGDSPVSRETVSLPVVFLRRGFLMIAEIFTNVPFNPISVVGLGDIFFRHRETQTGLACGITHGNGREQ